MIPLLMRIVGANQPVFVEGVLRSARNVNGVGRLVVGTDEIAGTPGAALQATRASERVRAGAAGEGTGAGGCVCVIDSLKCSRPSILSEIVVEHAESRPKHGLLAAAGRIGDSQARRDLLAVIVRHVGHDRNLQRLQGDVCAVLKLGSARTLEQPEGGLVTQAVVDRKVMRNAPGILRVEPSR
jgi:hypothetical protein